jgi:hypothetical protein
LDYVIPFLYGGIIFFGAVLLISVWMDMNTKNGQCHLFTLSISSHHGPSLEETEATERTECDILIIDGFVSIFLGFSLLVWSAITQEPNLRRWINGQLIAGCVGAVVQLGVSILLTTTMMYYCWNLEAGTTVEGCSAAAQRYDQEAATSHMLGNARSTVAHMSMSSLASWSIFMTWVSILICVLVRRFAIREMEAKKAQADYYRVSNNEVPDVASIDHPWKRYNQLHDETDDQVIFSASLYSPWDKDETPLVP